MFLPKKHSQEKSKPDPFHEVTSIFLTVFGNVCWAMVYRWIFGCYLNGARRGIKRILVLVDYATFVDFGENVMVYCRRAWIAQ